MKTLTITSSGQPVNTVTLTVPSPDKEIKRGGFYLRGGQIYICGHTENEKLHMTNLANGETYSSFQQIAEYYSDHGFERYSGPVSIAAAK